jgi:hypothetical protein
LQNTTIRESYPNPSPNIPIPLEETEQALLSPTTPSAHQTTTGTFALAAPYPQNEQPSHDRISPEAFVELAIQGLTVWAIRFGLAADIMKGIQILGQNEQPSHDRMSPDARYQALFLLGVSLSH